MYTQEIYIIHRREKFYLLEATLDREEVFKIDTELIEKIFSKTQETKDSIAILLTVIEIVRRNTYIKRKNEMMEDKEAVINSLIQLLMKYTAENLSNIFENLKYFEIQQIIESKNPIIELSKKI